MKTAFVTGASGFVGSHLCRELIEHGYKVRALIRPSSDLGSIRQLPIEYVEGDVTNLPSLRQGMAGVDVVFHLAALFRQAKYPDEMYWSVNHQGTLNALTAAKENNVGYFSYCSTTGVLGDVKNPPADESHPYGPLDVYQESKTEAEKSVLQSLRSGELKGSVIRPAMIWGPRDTRLFKLFRGVAHRRLPIIGSGATWCHWILVNDLVRAFRQSVDTPASYGQLYTIAGDRPVTLEYTMQRIADFYGVSLLPFRIPVSPVQLLGTLTEKICSPFGIEPPLHRRRVDFYVKNRSFITKKAADELLFKPTFPFEEEVKFVAQWYLDNGWINLPARRRTQTRDSRA